MDLAIVLILTSNIGSLKLEARNLLRIWLKQGTFSFNKLELILVLHRSNEVKPYNIKPSQNDFIFLRFFLLGNFLL